MHTISMLALMACVVVGVCNAFRRVSRGFSNKATRNGHLWPLGVSGFSLFSAGVYNLARSVLDIRLVLDLTALGVTVLCVAATITLLFYDPMLPRNKAAQPHPGAAGRKA